MKVGLAGREDVAVFPDLFERGGFAKTRRVFIIAGAFFAAPCVVGSGDPADVALGREWKLLAAGQHAACARFHFAHLSGVDEKRLAGSVAPAALHLLAGFLAADEPKAGGNAGSKEKLRRHGDDAIDEVGLDDVLADFALASAAFPLESTRP